MYVITAFVSWPLKCFGVKATLPKTLHWAVSSHRRNFHPLHQQHLHILTAVTLPVAPKVEKTAQKSSWLTPFYFINSFSFSWSCFGRARFKNQHTKQEIPSSSLLSQDTALRCNHFFFTLRSHPSLSQEIKNNGEISPCLLMVLSPFWFWFFFNPLFLSLFPSHKQRAGEEVQAEGKLLWQLSQQTGCEGWNMCMPLGTYPTYPSHFSGN